MRRCEWRIPAPPCRCSAAGAPRESYARRHPRRQSRRKDEVVCRKNMLRLTNRRHDDGPRDVEHDPACRACAAKRVQMPCMLGVRERTPRPLGQPAFASREPLEIDRIQMYRDLVRRNPRFDSQAVCHGVVDCDVPENRREFRGARVETARRLPRAPGCGDRGRTRSASTPISLA